MTRHACPNCGGTRRAVIFYGEDEFMGPCGYCSGRGWVSSEELRELLGADDEDDMDTAA